MLQINQLYNEDCIDTMAKIPDNFIDLTVTSPPYDSIRSYHGYSFSFEFIAQELFRVTKQGGVVIWVIGDATVKASETGTSFKQALYFKEIGFNLYDTMIWYKDWGGSGRRYNQRFDYMFVLSKGTPKTFNPIEDVKNNGMNKRRERQDLRFHYRDKEGEIIYGGCKPIKDYRKRDNIWFIGVGNNKSTKDKIAFQHPAIFPEQLAKDHIISWSNEDDIVYDPFAGSGTTGIIAYELKRGFILSEISKEYCDIIQKRFKDRFDISIYS